MIRFSRVADVIYEVHCLQRTNTCMKAYRDDGVRGAFVVGAQQTPLLCKRDQVVAADVVLER
jgi:hypothetical protein